MRVLVVSLLGALVPVLVAATGCDGPASDVQETRPEPSGPKHVRAEGLPALNDPLPLLDGGRVELSPPGDWKTYPRKAGYVARFYYYKTTALPRILVTVTEGENQGLAAATKDNLPELSKVVDAIIEKKYGKDTKLLEPAKQMIIGGQPWIRYVYKASLKGLIAECQVLKTVAGGRVYTVELQVIEGKLLDYRDDAYAVAGGMKFLSIAKEPDESDGQESAGGDVDDIGGLDAADKRAGENAE